MKYRITTIIAAVIERIAMIIAKICFPLPLYSHDWDREGLPAVTLHLLSSMQFLFRENGEQ